MAPNYQAGKDALAGFKRYFKGEIADEVYVPLNQLDYLGRARPRSRPPQPEAIFVFLPGGMGVNFVKQFRQAGLADNDHVPLGLHGRRVDAAGAAGRRARLLRRRRTGRPNLDNPQNKEFVADYEKEYDAVPGDLRVPGLRRGAADRQRRAGRSAARSTTRTRCAPP